MKNGDANCLAQNSLSHHLICFSRILRGRGVLVSPQQTADALQSLAVLDISDEALFRYGLRLNLCSSPEEQQIFDEEYERYFHEEAIREDRKPSPEMAKRKSQKEQSSPPEASARSEERQPDLADAVWRPVDQELEAESTRQVGRHVIPTAPWEARKQVLVRIPTKRNPLMEEGAKQLIAEFRLRQRRAWRRQLRGALLDFRRTIRSGLQTGGEPLLLSWKKRKPREANFLLFCDGSRSMSGFAETFLQFAYALSARSRQVEVFLFSTKLRRISRALRHARQADQTGQTGQTGQTAKTANTANTANTAKTSPPTVIAESAEWGSGTRIGESLHTFVRLYGGRLLRKDTVVLIASDGLDTGDGSRLEEAMKTISTKAACVIWLNPLLDVPGYEPIARGMRTALPYIDIFASARDLGSYRTLAKTIRLWR
ncbi:VWA domain-containing protein [Brevibacillus sp. FSL K6-2834]|uniref:vWA domain-containing protein n=1 Tax=Brevibacillus sp. FSL K6-2834 TaxID=2954680 RepID=UPI00315898E5